MPRIWFQEVRESGEVKAESAYLTACGEEWCHTVAVGVEVTPSLWRFDVPAPPPWTEEYVAFLRAGDRDSGPSVSVPVPELGLSSGLLVVLVVLGVLRRSRVRSRSPRLPSRGCA